MKNNKNILLLSLLVLSSSIMIMAGPNDITNDILRKAIRNNEIDVLENWLDEHLIDPNEPAPLDVQEASVDSPLRAPITFTPLMIAAEYGRGDVVKLFLRYGANPNKKILAMDALKRAALLPYVDIRLIQSNYTMPVASYEEVIRLLLEAGANKNEALYALNIQTKSAAKNPENNKRLLEAFQSINQMIETYQPEQSEQKDRKQY